MSGYICTRCLRSDDLARANGCVRGPCPMKPVSLNARLRPYGWSVGMIVCFAVIALCGLGGVLFLVLA